MNERKIIVIDWGICSHKSIFSLKFNPKIPVTFTALSIMIGWLYRIDLSPDDIVIIAADGRNSWRKDFETEYKANRKERREDSDIDWTKCFGELNKLLDEINNGLNIHVIKLDRIEADDIMAVVSRYYQNERVILCTHDRDLEQCFEYNNVRIFSTQTKKWKLKPENFDVNRLIAEKVYKETSDNMIAPILTETDYENRRLCVNLLQLPEWVELAIVEELKKIASKKEDINCIPFKTLRLRYYDIYNDRSKVISYELQASKETEKEDRKKKKKLEAKAKEQRAKDREAKRVAKLERDNLKMAKKLEKLANKNKEKEHVKVS